MLFDKFLDIINPQGIKCVVCGRDVAKDRYGFCDSCKKELPQNSRVCQKCGVDLRTMDLFCDECAKHDLAFDKARSVCRYEGLAQKLVYRLKFGGQKYLAKPLAHLMAEVLLNEDWQFDAVAFVPSGRETLKKRGYNQSQLIAQNICDIIKKPLVDLAEKVKDLSPQEQKTYDERFESMKGAFVIKQTSPQSVLIADDVKTTGATLSEMARLLKKHGCKNVYCITFASRVKSVPLAEL